MKIKWTHTPDLHRSVEMRWRIEISDQCSFYHGHILFVASRTVPGVVKDMKMKHESVVYRSETQDMSPYIQIIVSSNTT
jgi:hypothetical protein